MISREKLDSYISTKTPAFFVVQTAGEEGGWRFITSLEELRTLRLTQVVFAERVTRILDTPEKNTKGYFSSLYSFFWTSVTNLLKKIGSFLKKIKMNSSKPVEFEVEGELSEEKRRILLSLIDNP